MSQPQPPSSPSLVKVPMEAGMEPAFHLLPAGGLELRAEALGRLRRELLWAVGETRAHGIFARWGFSCGQHDAFQGTTGAGAFGGLAEVQELARESKTDRIEFEALKSVEAAEHRQVFPQATSPQCWLLSGYLTGWISRNSGHTVYVIETRCSAVEAGPCRFVGKPRKAWLAEGMDLSLFKEDNLFIDFTVAREQLQLTKDRYQNLFEQSISPLFIIDPDTGAHLNINVAAEELTGFSRAQLLSMNVFDLCHPQEHHRLMAEMKTLLGSQRTSDIEISLVRKDGLIRVIALSSKVLTYGGQRVIQSMMRDITDMKISAQKERDLQHQLTRSERLSTIGRLAAGVAHELKNPLGAIKNAIYYIRDALKNAPVLQSDPHLKEILKLAEGEVDASVVIIGELLDFSRVVQLVPRRSSINDLLERIPGVVTFPDNVTLHWDLDITLPSATVDPERLSQVFINMTLNALQAMPNGGRLTLRSRLVVESSGEENTSVSRIAVSIEDTGGGIEAIHLKKIFEPLFTTKARGTGLGLAISNNIVEKHGGAILVTSQPGKGTTFTIKLPLVPPGETEGEKP